jgi:hypothetical protein
MTGAGRPFVTMWRHLVPGWAYLRRKRRIDRRAVRPDHIEAMIAAAGEPTGIRRQRRQFRRLFAGLPDHEIKTNVLLASMLRRRNSSNATLADVTRTLSR